MISGDVWPRGRLQVPYSVCNEGWRLHLQGICLGNTAHRARTCVRHSNLANPAGSEGVSTLLVLNAYFAHLYEEEERADREVGP